MTLLSTDDQAPLPFSTSRHRDSMFLLAKIRVRDGETVEVRVRNLSEGGLMAEYERRAAIDDPVSLEMRGVGTIGGRIVWAEQGRVGIAFDQPIDPKAARKPVGGGATTPIYAKAPPRR